MKRVIGTILAISAVTTGLTAVACTTTIDGQGVANEADVTSYRSSVASVSSSAAASSAQAASNKGAVCGIFLTGALDAKFKLDTVKKRIDDDADHDATRTALVDAATALNTVGSDVSDTLAKYPNPAAFTSTLTEFSQAATSFGTEMTNLSQGTGTKDDFFSAQDRYYTARDAALDACS
ncbi:hypothetical protein JMUB6875_54520 [Nocardia sp. JMUB6875]|uniref:hypothetical protein n=1 Tax=Nocardia sp. JMUB6875 TaxID=3158170 RepID=UPI0032E5D3DE